ncbi:MAG: hypothetical protein A2W90_23650 [Bacteroidetes bacterium GWF2_42_66]|nr:MAG: hypothetical protein A2W92_19955 [Bacteroidetes bacterium GWA2_42_15]OFY00314.1 MAG: hypothetical protein A2W89_14015 [Bacteroidetes bacterium GWE2_42_39]OFY47116.1 MAG: hypothetical protein A2W90_23650 [Bacteroidetes bacterium GWF2_42_66]HBL76706.1 hypothetical protein [Prolixibacteraceae bacterium]HCU62913.1 hypothetical protein [Prolixibacteraceae bacterium]
MRRTFTLLIVGLLAVTSLTTKAQEWSTGVDLYSSYVWRGTKFGSGPALQPSVKFSAGGFAIGAWGSYCFSENEAMEADLYASYGFNLGENSSLTFTVTDYYFPGAGSEWLDGDFHFFEPAVSLGLGKFSLLGAYMTNAEDIYFEAGLKLNSVKLFAGAGDGAYTSDGDFSVCNLGIGTSKEIKITDSFSLPVSGSVILNPSTEQFHIVVGISL